MKYLYPNCPVKCDMSKNELIGINNSSGRMKIYKEFLEIYDQYRKLEGELKPFMRTSKNSTKYDRVVIIGCKLETKLKELQAVFDVERIPID